MKRFQLIAAAIAFLGCQALQANDSPAAVKTGEKAPEFTLMSEEGKRVSLSDYQGKNVILIFSRAHW